MVTVFFLTWSPLCGFEGKPKGKQTNKQTNKQNSVGVLNPEKRHPSCIKQISFLGIAERDSKECSPWDPFGIFACLLLALLQSPCLLFAQEAPNRIVTYPQKSVVFAKTLNKSPPFEGFPAFSWLFSGPQVCWLSRAFPGLSLQVSASWCSQ